MIDLPLGSFTVDLPDMNFYGKPSIMDSVETMRYIRPMTREEPYNTKTNKIFALFDLIETQEEVAIPRSVPNMTRARNLDPLTYQVDDTFATVNSIVGKKTESGDSVQSINIGMDSKAVDFYFLMKRLDYNYPEVYITFLNGSNDLQFFSICMSTQDMFTFIVKDT